MGCHVVQAVWKLTDMPHAGFLVALFFGRRHVPPETSVDV
jgi:hypothetical protein